VSAGRPPDAIIVSHPLRVGADARTHHPRCPRPAGRLDSSASTRPRTRPSISPSPASDRDQSLSLTTPSTCSGICAHQAPPLEPESWASRRRHRSTTPRLRPARSSSGAEVSAPGHTGANLHQGHNLLPEDPPVEECAPPEGRRSAAPQRSRRRWRRRSAVVRMSSHCQRQPPRPGSLPYMPCLSPSPTPPLLHALRHHGAARTLTARHRH
jgi:hypothetical protein